MTAADFATAVLNYCDATDASVDLWIESPARARKRTGGALCPHPLGLGADLTYDLAPIEAHAVRLAERFGLRLHRGAGYDHLEPLTWRPAGELPACVAFVAARRPGNRADARSAQPARALKESRA